MRRTLRSLGRSRQESIPENEESGLRPPLNPLGDTENFGPSATEQRRASESTSVTKSWLFQDELSERPKGPQHQSTSCSSFSTLGLQLTQKNNSKKVPTPDASGLSLVHDCDNPIADFIFVHGLGGSSKKTWSYDRDVRNFWPPWLGSEVGLSNTRIFAFGYNAHFKGESTSLSILDFAKDLLFQTRTYQHEQKDNDVPIGAHPMIFVVHSMGGLVVKKAYIIGKTDDQFADMISRTYGIVFLGTPHRGSNLASTLNKILRVSPSRTAKVYVNELERGSTSLSDINEQFRIYAEP